MIDRGEIIKGYMYTQIKGERIGLEDYVREIFKGKNKDELKQYCEEENIYYKKSFSKEMLFQKIYDSCNRILSYMILKTSDITNEKRTDYYKRIYIREFDI